MCHGTGRPGNSGASPTSCPSWGRASRIPPRGRTRQSLPRSGRMASFENVSAGGRTRPGLERIRRCAEERGPDPGRRPPPDGRMLRRTWPRRLPGPGRGGRLGGRRSSERGSSLVRKCTAARLGAEQKCALLCNGPRKAPRGYTRGKGVQWASERAETSTTGNRSEKTGGCLCGRRFLWVKVISKPTVKKILKTQTQRFDLTQ